MSDFPSPALIAHVEALILQTFEVSCQEAHYHARDLAAIVEGRAGPNEALQLDWTFRLKMDLGEKLPWRSGAERDTFRQEQTERRKVHEFFIQRSKRA